MRWLLVLSSIPFLSIVAAFGIAPHTLSTDISTVPVTEVIALPVNPEREQPLDALWQIDQVRRDDTLVSLLERINVRDAEIIEFLRQAPQSHLFSSQLRPGKTVFSKTTHEGVLLELQLVLDNGSVLQISKSGQGYIIQKIPLALEKHIETKTTSIVSSLFAATDAADIPDSVAMQLANIFSSEIDFNQDLREKDYFSVIYEAYYSNGKRVRTGRVLAAEFFNQDRTLRALLYSTPDGRDHYYTPDGKSLQKAFLRSPLEFTRISSGFSLARFHPILQTWRAHKGVDYAAPIGTRVRAVADATVSFVGTQGGYGNVVVLQHAHGISTVYGHLSKFAAGLRRGQKIRQGELIGFVGMSGLASGPHLHYEFRVHGVHRDPLTVALPSPQPLPRSQFDEFSRRTAPLLAQLDLLHNRNIASLD